MGQVPTQKPRAKQPRRFLEYGKYVERFTRDVLAMQRLWLVPLALCAFWLAIENNYQIFNTIARERQALVEDLERAGRSRGAIANQYARAVAATPSGQDLNQEQYRAWQQGVRAAVQRTATFRERNDQLTSLRAELKQRNERIQRLREQAVNLRVAGTEMPSRLSYAPTLWLAALLAWLLYFETLRSRAQKHLAAAVADYGDKPAPFGVAEESSVWIAPIPDAISLRVSGEDKPVRVPRSSMLAFLGWTEGDDRRSHRFALFAWAVIAAVAIRVLFIAARVNSHAAVAAEFTHPIESVLNTIAVALLAPLCLWASWRLASKLSDANGRDLTIERRHLLVLGASFAALAVLIWNTSKVETWLAGQRRRRVRTGVDALLRFPRFIPQDARVARRRNYDVVMRSDPGTVWATLPRAEQGGPPWMRTFRGTGSDRRTRFYSIAKELRRLRRVEPAAFRQYAERVRLAPPPPRKGRPQEVPIAPLEAAALALIERRKLWSACDVLLGACRLTIRTERPDRRVFDLLIGLTTRYPTLARYRAQALALVKPPGGALPFPGSPRARLASRMQIWDGDNWKRRWQRPGPLHWGHPFETVERVTRRWIFFGERSITRRARLVLLPGGHPRPVLLPRGA